MSSTFLPNTLAPLVDPKTGRIVSPWNTFFQQLVQAAPAVQDVSTSSPFQANVAGTVIISGQTTVSLSRGPISIALTPPTTQKIIPISVGDIVSWTGAAIVKFLGA